MKPQEEIKTERITLTPKRLAVMQTISKDVIADIKFQVSNENELDFITDTMRARLEATVLSSQCQIQRVYHYTEKPSFWDWFHGRSKKITIEIEVNDLMLNPPKIDSARSYNLEIISVEKTNL